MKIIKERKKYIIFDEISNIKTTDIPLSLTRKYSKPLETGDAYLVEDGDVKKIIVNDMGEEAKGMCLAFLSEVDEADSYLY